MGRDWGERRTSPEERSRDSRRVVAIAIVGNVLLFGALIGGWLGLIGA